MEKIVAEAAKSQLDGEVIHSSMPQSTANLAKNIVGAGMLSLPSGVAAFSGKPQAVLPALGLTLIFGLLSAYGFILIADSCRRTGELSYQGAWAKTVSSGSRWIPAFACVAKAALGCISFSMILADCVSLMLPSLSIANFGGRSTALLAVTGAVIFPLCNLKSLAPLAKFSVLGVLSSVYISCFILFRCVDGSYRPGGAYYALAPVAPAFAPASGPLLGPGVIVLVSILATAFLAHYNAPLFYEQLAPGPDGRRDRRFLLVSVVGFALAGTIFSLVLAGGFLTFGTSCSGLILNSYAATDRLATLARVAIALSLLTAYPLVFLSLRKQFLELGGPAWSTLAAKRPTAVTVLLLSVITIVALKLHDLGRVAAFAGACFGSFLIYVAPALMALRAHQLKLGTHQSGAIGAANIALQIMLVPLGLTLGAIGAVRALR